MDRNTVTSRQCVCVAILLLLVSSVQAAGWETRSPMPTARALFATAVVAGKIYIIGGSPSGSGQPQLATVECYDPKTDTWTTRAGMPTARHGAGSAVINGKVYVFGGEKGTARLAITEVYDPAADSWSSVQNMNVPRYHIGGVAFRSRAYAFGGRASRSVAEVYDPVADTWTALAHLPCPVENMGITTLGDEIHLVGGTPGSGASDCYQIYDPATDLWHLGPSLPQRSNGCRIAAVGDTLYAVGGYDGSRPLDKMWRLEPNTDDWVPGDSMPTARQAFGIAVMDGYLYAIGGTDGSRTFRTVEAYPVPQSKPTDSEQIYWTDYHAGHIQRADLDGANPQVVIAGLANPTGIAVDTTQSTVYWTEWSSGKIRRARLDGTGVEDLVHGIGGPYGLALDIVANKMYWTSQHQRNIQRANLDGSGVEELVRGLGSPESVVLDLARGQMYWVQLGVIRRANLDGTNVETLVQTGLIDTRGIALDSTNRKMYWTDTGTDSIRRADLDGTNIETLIETGLDYPQGISLHLASGMMYWADPGNDTIRKANLDGSGMEVIVTQASGPQFIAFSTPLDSRPLLTLGAISPVQGSATGGTEIQATGQGFHPGIEVNVAAVPATEVDFVSPSDIVFVTPPGSPGQADIVVTNPDGQSAILEAGFTYIAAPQLTSVVPSVGPTGGETAVTLTGIHFQDGAIVMLGDKLATDVSFVSSNEIRGLTPPNPVGVVDVTITNPDGQSTTLKDGFTYGPATSPLVSISGTVTRTDGSPAGDGLTVTVTNERVGVSGTSTTGHIGDSGYALTLFGISSVHTAGDVISFTVSTAEGVVRGEKQLVLPDSIATNLVLVVDLQLSPPATNVAVTVSPDALEADDQSIADIIVRLEDDAGFPVWLDSVVLSVDIGSLGNVTNHGDGTYSATYTASRETGVATIMATTSNGSQGAVSLALQDTLPPVANAGDDQVVETNTVVTLDGSGSSDNIRIVAYEWDFNVDTGEDSDARTAVATTTYGRPGVYTARLKVADAAGNTATDDVIITVGGLVIEGYVLEADGTPLTVDDVAQAIITVPGSPAPLHAPVQQGVYSVLLDSTALADLGARDTLEIQIISTVSTEQMFSQRASITIEEQHLATGVLGVPPIRTDRTSTFTVSGTVRTPTGEPVSEAPIALRDITSTTDVDGRYTLILQDFLTNPVEGEILTIQAGWTEQQVITALADRSAQLDIILSQLRLGGLAINTHRPMQRINDILEDELALVDPATSFVIRSTVLNEITPHEFFPIYPLPTYTQTYPTAPSVFDSIENLDLENLGNALCPLPRNLMAEALGEHDAQLPVVVVGNQLNLYLVAPTTAVADVTFQLIGSQRLVGDTGQVMAADPVLTNHQFHLEEELALLYLPSWPGLDPADPNPPRVFDRVTLRYAPGGLWDRTSVSESDYLSEPMISQIVGGRQVWTATPLLEAGQHYAYFFEVSLEQPLTMLASGDLPLQISRWWLPDPRNHQIEDRGMMDRLIQIAQPVLREEIQQLYQLPFTDDFLEVMTDRLADRLDEVFAPEMEAIVADMLASGEPNVISYFSIPDVPSPTEGSFWSSRFDLAHIPDGVYEVVIDAIDSTGNMVDRIAGKQIILDRSASETHVSLESSVDAAIYQRRDGVYVAAGKSPVASLRLTAAPFVPDDEGVLFQILPYVADAVDQSSYPWLPVNTASIPLFILDQLTAQQREEMLATAARGESALDLLQSFLATTPDPGLEALLGAMLAADPDGMRLLDSTLSVSASLLAMIAPEPSRYADPASFLMLPFGTLRNVLALVDVADLTPRNFGVPMADVFIPMQGEFWLRAVPFDSVLNMETSTPPIRLSVVSPEADALAFTHISIGDQNGDGDDSDAFESGPAEGFRLFADTKRVELTGQLTHRTAHPVTLSVEYALSASPNDWYSIAESIMDENEGATGNSMSFEWYDDFSTLSQQTDAVMVRMRAHNALDIEETHEVSIGIEDHPLREEPASILTVTGTVFLPSGEPVAAELKVTIRNQNTGVELQTTTSESGTYIGTLTDPDTGYVALLGDELAVSVSYLDSVLGQATHTLEFGETLATKISIDVMNDPMVATDLTPRTGPEKGGTPFRITGNQFASETTVTIDGQPVESLQVHPPDTITGETPPGTGTVDLIVSHPDGQEAILAFAYVPAPVVVGVSPSTLSPSGGDQIAIQGRSFQTDAAVTLAGFPATNVVVISSTQIRAISPPISSDTVELIVTNPDGQSDGFMLGINPSPKLLGVLPAKGPVAGGTQLTLKGQDFRKGATVTVGGRHATDTTFVSDTQLLAVTPSGSRGTADVVVTNPDSQFTQLINAFAYLPAPSIVDVSPKLVSAHLGPKLMITGEDFEPGVVVQIGEMNVEEVVYVSASSLEVTCPALSEGKVDVTVSNSDGQSGVLRRVLTVDNTFRVVGSWPEHQAYHVPVTLSAVEFDFGEEIDPSGLSSDSIVVQGSRIYEASIEFAEGRLLCQPVETFGEEEAIQISIRAALNDLAGNSLADEFVLTFTTGLAVWPGDTNHDAQVNLLDVLPIIRHWEQTGTPREAPSSGWRLQPVESWSTKTATYADANGDGVIDEQDIIPVANNWLAQREIPSVTAPLLPPACEATSLPSSAAIYERLLHALESMDATGPGVASLREWLQQQLRRLMRSSLPSETRMLPNYPNPFNPETWIPYELAESTDVSFRIYDVSGNIVRGLSLGHRPAGVYLSQSDAAYWDGRNDAGEFVSSGVYFYQIQAGNFSAMRRLVILK